MSAYAAQGVEGRASVLVCMTAGLPGETAGGMLVAVSAGRALLQPQRIDAGQGADLVPVGRATRHAYGT